MTEAAGRPEQRTTYYYWHPTLNLPTSTTQDGQSISYQYDQSGRTTQKTVSDGNTTRTTTYAYNAQGLVTSIVGPRTDVNDVTSYTYDSLGNMLTATNPLGQTTSYANYTALGLPGQIRYPDGTTRTYTYDARGRVLTDTYAGTSATTAYNANGDVASVTLNDGSSVTNVYDSAHHLIETDNSHGEKIKYTLDAVGRVTRTDTYDNSNTLVATSSASYDGMGRKVLVTDANGKWTQSVYDNVGNVTSTNAPLNHWSQSNYDGLNRRTMYNAPSGTVWFGYNSFDKLMSVLDVRNNTTSYTYNLFGDQLSLTSPDTGTSTFTYDKGSNTLTKVDARQKTTTNTYDAFGRLTHVGYSDGQGVAMTYDIASNGVGRLASMTDLAGTTSYTYDVNGRVATKTQVVQGVSLRLAFGRDSLGRVTSVTYPSGKILAITYANERPVSMTWNGATVISGIQYFPFGAAESWLFGGTREYTRYIDANNRIWKYLTPTGSRSLTYDDAWQITKVTDSATGQTQNFTYDDASRVLTFSGFTSAATSETRSYTYDYVGNRASANVNGAAYTYTYPTSSNQLQSVSGLSYNNYDASGNLLSDGWRQHTYDARGRLTQTVGQGIGTYSYQYNGNGQRVFKLNNGAGKIWIYDDAGNPVGEYAYPGGAPVQELIWLGATPVAVAASLSQGQKQYSYGLGYIWPDHLGTPRAIINSGGTQIWQWDSAPFGDTAANSNPSGLGTFTFNHRFPGQYLDESGVHQNGARVYDPAIGRYIQSDPIGLLGGVSTYAYALGNPIQSADPTGLFRYGDIQPSRIDFVTGTVTFYVPFLAIGWGGTLSVDRYGNVYGGFVGSFGMPSAFSGSLMAGTFNQPGTPTPGQLSNLLSGTGLTFTAGNVVGAGITTSPGNGSATLSGITTPGATVEVGPNSSLIGNIGIGATPPGSCTP